MGRGKVQLKLIEDNSSRHVTFSKRRNGLLKKARELSVLCDVEVGLIIFSCKGKLSEYCGHSSFRCMEKILERYKKYKAAERKVNHYDCQQQLLCQKEMDDFQSTLLFAMQENDDQELTPCISDTFLQELDIDQLNINEIEQREQHLETILRQMRSRKASLMKLMRDAIRSLHEQINSRQEDKDSPGKVESTELTNSNQSDNRKLPQIQDLNESLFDSS